MLLAGFENSASLLAYIVYNLAKHPAEAAKLQAELDGVKGEQCPCGTHAWHAGWLQLAAAVKCMAAPVLGIDTNDVQIRMSPELLGALQGLCPLQQWISYHILRP